MAYNVYKTYSLVGVVEVVLKGYHEKGGNAALVLDGKPPLLHLEGADEGEEELLVHYELSEAVQQSHDVLGIGAFGHLDVRWERI